MSLSRTWGIMRRTSVLFPVVCLGLLVVGFWSSWAASPALDPAKQTEWEYEVALLGPSKGATDTEKIEKVLNANAKDGWELSQAVPFSDANGPNQLLLVFRRAKPRP